MKRVFLLLTACVMAFSAVAQKTLTIPRLTQAPPLEGVAGPIWQNVPARDDFDAPGGNLQSGQFRLAWTDSAFFLLLEVTQNPFRPQWVTGLSNWESDRTEVFFNVSGDHRAALGPNPGHAATGGSWENGFFQFVTAWPTATVDGVMASGTADTVRWNFRDWPADKGAYHDAFVRDDAFGEWTYMAIYPFRTLTDTMVAVGQEHPGVVLTQDTVGGLNIKANPFVGAVGAQFGFEVQITANTDANVRYFNNWSAPSGLAGTEGLLETWNTFQNAAIVTLGADTVVLPQVSVPTLAAKVVNVFPNPAVDVVNVALSRNADIAILNVKGSVVKLIRNSNGQNIDVSSLPAGMYIIRANNYVGRFVKR